MASLDYYLILSGPDSHRSPDGILVEEFVLHKDCTSARLRSTGWTATDPRWWSSARFSRAVRTDPSLAARIVPAARGDAEKVFLQHRAGPLPNETMLRNNFGDDVTFPASPALNLRPVGVPAGFRQRRLYRVLFAKDLGPAELANLQNLWQSAVAELREPGARVMASARLREGDDLFTWDLRRVGPGLAWGLDVTVLMGGHAEDAIARVLGELISAVRGQGLIPVTTERFA